MSREIEFRAWLKNRKKMRRVCAIDFSSNEVDCSGNDEYLGWYQEFVLMQYTGLKDKNGVKIFEGDIVKHSDIVCEVAWSEYMSRFILVNIKDEIESFSLIDNVVNTNEVIGNIYENKELLEND